VVFDMLFVVGLWNGAGWIVGGDGSLALLGSL